MRRNFNIADQKYQVSQQQQDTAEEITKTFKIFKGVKGSFIMFEMQKKNFNLNKISQS